MASKNKRRKSVVDARVQWTLAGRVVMHFFVFICGGAFFGLIFQYLSNPLGSLSDHLHNFWKQSAPMLVAMVCLIPVFIRDTLTLSNRVVGPICRLRDTMKRIAAGEDVPPLKFRKRDMWDDLPGLFNGMVNHLSHNSTGNDKTVIERNATETKQDAPELVEA